MTLYPFGPLGQPQPVASSVPTITFVGASGVEYLFTVYALGTHFKPTPGVYGISKETSPKVLSPLYFGEADNFDDRVGSNFIGHHKWTTAILSGATHICLHVVRGGKTERCAIETDLRHSYNPPLNDQ